MATESQLQDHRDYTREEAVAVARLAVPDALSSLDGTIADLSSACEKIALEVVTTIGRLAPIIRDTPEPALVPADRTLAVPSTGCEVSRQIEQRASTVLALADSLVRLTEDLASARHRLEV